MLRVLSLASLMVLSLAFEASTGGVLSYSANFSYASEAEPHLGGDDFGISSVRIDHGTGRAEIAKVTAFGRMLSLEYRDIASPGAPSLPVAKPKPQLSNNAPPVVVEGRGPVGVAARGKSSSSIDVRQNEPSDPSAMRVDSAWAEYDMTLRKLAGAKLKNGTKGVYIQLRALEARASSPSAIKLGRDDVKQDPFLESLLGAPFAYLPVGGEARLAELNPAIRLKMGESRLLTLQGRLFVATRYDLK